MRWHLIGRYRKFFLSTSNLYQEEVTEISELEPQIEDTQDELIRHQQKTKQFKEYIQGLFIDVYTQDEFNRRVDAIFNETFKGDDK